MASATEPEYVRCAACGDSATTSRAFLLDCCACDKSYHHTCATPPLTEDALLKRATATRHKKATGTIHDWRCHNCLMRQQLECQDDVIIISSDESDREKTPTPPPPPPPPTSVWKKSVFDLSPANRPAAPRLYNQGASSLRVGLDHVATTRSAAAQRAPAINSRDPSLPALEPGSSRPKVASTSVPVLPSNLRHSITASTSSKMVKTPTFPAPSRMPSQTLPDIDCSKLRKRSRSASGSKERPSKRVKREGHQSSGSLFERIHHAEANNRPPREPSRGPRQPSPMSLDDNRNPDPPAIQEPPPAVDVFGMPLEMIFPGDEPEPPPPLPPDSEEDNKPAAFRDDPSTQAVQRESTPQPNGKSAVPAGVDVVDLTPDADDEDAPPPSTAKPPAASASERPRVANPTPPASKSAPPPDDHKKILKDALPAHPPHVAKVVPTKRQLSPGQADGQTIGKQVRTDASKLPAQPPARWKDDAVRQDGVAGLNSASVGPSTSMQPPHVPQSYRPPAHPPPASQHTRTPTAPAHAYERLVSLPPIVCLQSDDEHSGTSTPAPVCQPTPHAFSDYDELDDKGEGAEEEESQDGRAQRGRLQEHIRGFQRRRGMDAAQGLPAPASPPPTPAPPRATSSQPAGPRLHGERRGRAPHVPRTPSPSPALSKAALWGAAASPQSPSKDALWSAAATSNYAAATATSNPTAAASNHASHRALAPPTHKKPKVAAAVPAPAPAKDTPAPPPAGFAVPRPPPAAAPQPPKDADADAPDEAKAAHELMYARFILNYYDGVGPPPHDARLWRRARRTIATRTDAVRVVEAWERAQAGPSAEGSFAQLEPGQEEQDVQQAEEEEREEARPPADESVVETSLQEECEMSMPRPPLPLLATTSLRRQLSTLELGSTSSSGEVSESMQADGGAVIRVDSVVCTKDTKVRQRQTARKTVARRSVPSGDAGSSAGPSKLAKASVDVEVSEAGSSNASSKKSSARGTSSGQSKSSRFITVSGPAPGMAPHLHPPARTTSNASAGAVAAPARPVHLDDVVARLTARRVANPAPPVGSTPVKGRGRARRAALERRLLDGKVLSDAYADTRRKRREVMIAVNRAGSRAPESRLVVQRAPRDALDRAR